MPETSLQTRYAMVKKRKIAMDEEVDPTTSSSNPLPAKPTKRPRHEELPWTEEEDNLLKSLTLGRKHRQDPSAGGSWKNLASHFGERSKNEVSKRWASLHPELARRDPPSAKPISASEGIAVIEQSSPSTPSTPSSPSILVRNSSEFPAEPPHKWRRDGEEIRIETSLSSAHPSVGENEKSEAFTPIPSLSTSATVTELQSSLAPPDWTITSPAQLRRAAVYDKLAEAGALFGRMLEELQRDPL